MWKGPGKEDEEEKRSRGRSWVVDVEVGGDDVNVNVDGMNREVEDGWRW